MKPFDPKKQFSKFIGADFLKNLNKEKVSFLLVEDDLSLAQAIKLNIEPNWDFYHIKSANEEIPNVKFSIALVDIHLSNTDIKEGLEIIKKINLENPSCEIIGYSGDLNQENMNIAINNGASKFLAKPLAFEELNSILDQIYNYKILTNKEHVYSANKKYQEWIGKSQASQNVLKLISSLKNEKAPILINGETGTGKEVCVQLLHSLNPSKAFIPINMAAIPENLFESQMFGHTKGSFTGAQNDSVGFIGMAHNGILFLDEIEALPLNLQAKLLRFLESGESQKIGSKVIQKFNTNIITATNINLKKLVEKKQFREDLFWRLSGKQINLPPLRERKTDIPQLLTYYLNKQAPKYNKSFLKETINLLTNYRWPGNIRELKRFCEQIVLLSPLPFIRPEDIKYLLVNKPDSSTSISSNKVKSDLCNMSLNDLVGEYEKEVLLKRLKLYNDVSKAAVSLKISKSSLYQKIKHLNLSSKEFS